MLKLTTPKNSNNTLFYVSSESHPEAQPHIVVRHVGIFFCDCRDFMVRKLPKLGTSQFDLCKHGRFVRDVIGTVPASAKLIAAVQNTPEVPPKSKKSSTRYGIYYIRVVHDKKPFRSLDYTRSYPSKEAAQKAIDKIPMLNPRDWYAPFQIGSPSVREI